MLRAASCASLGMGAIGQFAARFLAAAGARVVAPIVKPNRLRTQPRAASRSTSPSTPLDEQLRELDAVIEATGKSEETRTLRASAAGPAATIVLLSYYDG